MTGFSGSSPISESRLRDDALPVPPVDILGQPVHLVEPEAEGLAHVADRALRAVGDHGGGEGGALAAVLPVEVLDHGLAALVLEIDIDVGGLVALLGDEALEQDLDARGVHLGDPEAVADRRVGRRAPPLAQDPLGAGKAHDVLDRQEIGLIAQLRDEHELVLHLGPDLGRHPARPAPGHTGMGQGPEVARRRLARRHQLLRILVAQLIEREPAAPRDLEGLAQEPLGIKTGQRLPIAEMALAVRVEGVTRGLERGPEPDGRERILQGLPLAAVHVYIPGRAERQAGVTAQAFEPA